MASSRRKAPVLRPEGLVGRPVCVVLNDGSYYIGMLTGADGSGITMDGMQGSGRLAKGTRKRKRLRREERARVSGLLGSLFGGGGLSPAATGLFGGGTGGGKPGFWGMLWPGLKFGIGMIQTIMPLLGLFKI